MKHEIRERLDKRITKETINHEVFSLIVETTESQWNCTSQMTSENVFEASNTTDGITSTMVINDEYDYTTIILRQPDGNDLGSIVCHANGEINESYNKLPRAIRVVVYDYVDAIAEAIDDYINHRNEE